MKSTEDGNGSRIHVRKKRIGRATGIRVTQVTWERVKSTEDRR